MPHAFLLSALVALALSPAAARFATQLGIVSSPTVDRWHRTPTPLLGGLAVGAGTVAAVLVFGVGGPAAAAVLATSVGSLVLGLVDDNIALGPTAKLVGSLVIGSVLVYMLSLSTSRVPPASTVVLSVLWFAGTVHAINVLDNIDGLAAGIGAVASLGMAYVLVACGAPAPSVLLVALAGGLLGFLPWNVHPARVFMGDGGSLFVGSILGGASLVPLFDGKPHKPLWPLAIAIALTVPIGEAAFVSAMRWMAGRKATRGGTDHLSHRLVALGFSEQRSVGLLYAVGIVAALIAVWTAESGGTALPAAAMLAVSVGLGALYLAHVPTYHGDDFSALNRLPFGAALRAAVLRSHAAHVCLDLVLITTSYYAAYRLRFAGDALAIFLPSFAASLPIVLTCKLAAHYGSGLYRRSWHTFGVTDFPAVFRAIGLGTTASILAATYLYRFERFSRGVFIIDAALLLTVVLTTRLSFRLMAHATVTQSARSRRALIVGARERGQLLARELLLNTSWGLKPVGFVDAGAPAQDSILGLRVYQAAALRKLALELRVDEVVLSGDPMDTVAHGDVLCACVDLGVPIRELVFEITRPLVGTSGSSVA